jgi:hypothetical protein
MFAAILAQLVVPNVSTSEASFFSSSTVHAPLLVAETLREIVCQHLLKHWASFRPGTFAAMPVPIVAAEGIYRRNQLIFFFYRPPFLKSWFTTIGT